MLQDHARELSAELNATRARLGNATYMQQLIQTVMAAWCLSLAVEGRLWQFKH